MKALSHQATKQTLVTASPDAIARKCLAARLVWAIIGATALAVAYAAGSSPGSAPPVASLYVAALGFAWVHPRLERLPDVVDLEILAHGGSTEIERLHELNRLRAAFAQQKVIAVAAFIGAAGVANPWFPAVTLCVLLVIRETYFRRPRAAGY